MEVAGFAKAKGWDICNLDGRLCISLWLCWDYVLTLRQCVHSQYSTFGFSLFRSRQSGQRPEHQLWGEQIMGIFNTLANWPIIVPLNWILALYADVYRPCQPCSGIMASKGFIHISSDLVGPDSCAESEALSLEWLPQNSTVSWTNPRTAKSTCTRFSKEEDLAKGVSDCLPRLAPTHLQSMIWSSPTRRRQVSNIMHGHLERSEAWFRGIEARRLRIWRLKLPLVYRLTGVWEWALNIRLNLVLPIAKEHKFAVSQCVWLSRFIYQRLYLIPSSSHAHEFAHT